MKNRSSFSHERSVRGRDRFHYLPTPPKLAFPLLLAVLGVPLVVAPAACRGFGTTESPIDGEAGDAPNVAGAHASGAATGGGGGKALGTSGEASFDGGGAAGDAGASGSAASGSGGMAGLGGTGAGDTGGGAGDPNHAGGQAGAPNEEREPDSFDGLALWIEATEEYCSRDDSQRISSCLDRSGNGNEARQEQPGWRPGLDESKINGRPALFLSRALAGAPDAATFLVVSDSKSLRFGEDDFAYVVVASWHNAATPGANYAGYGRVLSKQSPTPPYDGLALLANYPGINPTGKTATRFAAQLDVFGTVALSSRTSLNDDEVRVYAAWRAAGALSVRINGETVGQVYTPPANVSTPDAPVLIGGSQGEGLDGNIAEIVILRGISSLEDLSALEHHLMSKYAIVPSRAMRSVD